MSSALVIGCIFEDRAYELVAKPVIERVLEDEEVPAEVLVSFTHGCRFEPLNRITSKPAVRPDLWIIGADCGKRTPAQKQRAMQKHVSLSQPIVFALAQPGAEGWLQADLSAFKEGLEEALGKGIALPASPGGYPRSEAGAKDRLAKLVAASGVAALNRGLEYGPHVMMRVPLDAHASLDRFVTALRRCLRELQL